MESLWRAAVVGALARSHIRTRARSRPQDMIPFSNHPLYRFFWGWLGAPEVSLLKLFQGPVIRQASVNAHVVQESCMPVRRLEEGLNKFEQW